MARILVILVLVLTTGAAWARQPDVDALGPQVGERVPDFSGIDQSGVRRTLQSVMGSNGAMLVFYRSADW